MVQKMLRIWLNLLVGVSALTFTASAAADSSDWMSRAWQLDEGLPGNSVTGIAQTPDGYLWVATEGGLARFDGARFQNITVPIPSGRSRPIVRSMLLGQDHQLWLALEGGHVIALSGQTSKLFTKADGLSGVRCENMAQDRAGNIWTSHSDGGVCRIAHGQVTRFAESDAPAGHGPCFLASDLQGQVWFARENNIGIIRDGVFQTILKPGARVARLGRARAGGVWACAGLQLQHCLENGQTVSCGFLPVERSGVEPTAVFEDQTGAVWIGTSVNGLFRYDGTHFTRAETSNEMILSLAEDREGNVWAGTGGGGLDRLRPRLVELQSGESGLPSATIRSICQDNGDAMWAVAENGGLARRTGGVWKTLGSEDGWSGARATCVSGDHQGRVWIGTAHDGLRCWENGQFRVLGRANGLGGEVVRGLLVDHAGDLWIALDSPACLQRLHQDKFQTFRQGTKGAIRAMSEDTKGMLWCGTQDGFLFRQEGKELKNETPRTAAQPAPIRCMQAMPDGSVWIGYAGAGLGIWRDKKLALVTEKQGLFDAYICSMGADDNGGFWCATDHGIFHVPVREIEAVAAGRADHVNSIQLGLDEGLQNLQGAFGYAPGAARGPEGCLWFPMRSGLAMVNPLRIPNTRAPLSVLIERVAVDDQPAKASPSGRLILPPTHQRLDVDFTAPTFIAAENVRFRYRLQGWDTGWNEGGTHRRATYSRLPAGDYTFGVIARNNAGVWNTKETTVALTVPPFFWGRWPVRLASLSVFTLGVVATARYASYRRLARRLTRLEQETSLYRERSRIAQDLHDDIGASLTHIALLSELAQKDFDNPLQAKGHIDQIFRSAKTVVRSLDEIVWTVNPKNDTLDVLITYLCTYAPDYLRSASIRCRLDVPLDVPAVPLPSQVAHHLFLAVKETLHNIVKHAGATEVWLRLRFAAETLTLTIEDNGRGFQSEDLTAPDADGLGNLHQRLGSIGGSCTQQSEPGTGTTSLLTVPLKRPQS